MEPIEYTFYFLLIFRLRDAAIQYGDPHAAQLPHPIPAPISKHRELRLVAAQRAVYLEQVVQRHF